MADVYEGSVLWKLEVTWWCQELFIHLFHGLFSSSWLVCTSVFCNC